jgi:hypothetical protein
MAGFAGIFGKFFEGVVNLEGINFFVVNFEKY